MLFLNLAKKIISELRRAYWKILFDVSRGL